MELYLTEYDNGPCPYIENKTWITQNFYVEKMENSIYEALIDEGFRRCGISFYKNKCDNCRLCVPLKVDVNEFRLSRSQKRVLKKNKNIAIFRYPAYFEEKGFKLYRKYCNYKHTSEIIIEKKDYYHFLIESPVTTEMTHYCIGKKLIGIGWIDVLETSISSVYFAFDPDYSAHSLGVFSILKEIELCKKLNKKWLQLGFWVKKSPKMSYKNQYKPYRLLIDGKWNENF